MLLLALQVSDATRIDINSAISLGLMVVLAGLIWRASSLLADIKHALRKLRYVPARLDHIEDHLLLFEEDVNNLFGAVRAGDESGKLHELTRRSRFRRFRGNPDEEDIDL